jgi:putative N6-adenine-specific DNA methylase
VASELEALGERPRIDEGGGGVSWTGDARSLMRANLWLRTASRVLVRVATFEATAFFELEKRARKIPWASFLGPGIPPTFRVTAKKSKLYHSDAIAQRLTQAAVKQVQVGRRSHRRPSSDERQLAPSSVPRSARNDQSQLFVVRVVRDQFTISADTSGELLHVRGYRQAVAKAPMRETLAAALLMGSGWNGTTPLIDPMCGSGTIPIEGAMIARRMAPGLARDFAFMRWPDFDRRSWDEIVRSATTAALASSPVPIVGSDRDAGAIDSAIANAERAGVRNDLKLAVRALSELQPTDEPGTVAINPPYGVRVGDARKLRDLYAQVGNLLRHRCPGWTLAILAADERLVRHTGLELQPVFATTNGGIRVVAWRGTA